MGNRQRQRLLPRKLSMSWLEPINTSWCLEQICESNYQKLLQLIPALTDFKQTAIGISSHKPALHLVVLERNPYTMTIQLSHRFSTLHELMLPAVTIRVYLDAQLAEVLCDADRPAVSRVYRNPGKVVEIGQYKWRLNYFLQKWLEHCLKTQYQFSESADDANEFRYLS